MNLSLRSPPSRSGRSWITQSQRDVQKRLIERLAEPRVESARLTGLPDCYKIKLRDAGYRLVYQVCDSLLVVVVIAVGKREKSQVYHNAKDRI